MNFIQVGTKLINLDNVTNINLEYTHFKGDGTAIERCVRFVFNVATNSEIHSMIFTNGDAVKAREILLKAEIIKFG